MKRIKIFYLMAANLFAACFFILVAQAHVFNVSTLAQFQNALTESAANGEDDTIHLSAGIYTLSSTLTYHCSENHTLTVIGAGNSATFLTGSDTLQILSATTTQPDANVAIQDMTFQNGATTTNGGAVSITTVGGDISLDDCEVSESIASGGESVGGGASLGTDTGTIAVSSCRFIKNHSNGNVGGLYAATVTGVLQMRDCTFEQNSVVNTGGSEYYGDGGGAMFYSDGTSTGEIFNNFFINNSVSGGENSDGGGLMTYQLGANSTLTLERNSFIGNSASLGGAGCILRFNASGNATVRFNSFSENQTTTGTGAGAMVYIDSGILTYSGNTHTQNISGEDGAGAWISLSSGDAVISDNVFSGNQSTNNGGGLSVVTESASLTFTQNIFYNNQAENIGGGLSYATTSGVLTGLNNTFYGNTASSDGGAAYLYFDQNTATSTFKNNILWQDSPNELGYSSGSGSSTIMMTYSDVQNGTGESWFGAGCISSDPMFVNPAAGELALEWANFPTGDGSKSPCIDTADPSTENDADGTRADMGAIAFLQSQPAVTISDMALTHPLPLQQGDVLAVAVDAAAADDSTLYYKFYYCGNYGTASYDTSTWHVVQPYSKSARATYTFSEAGSYVIVVRVVTNPANEPADLPIVGGVVTVGGDSHSVNCFDFSSNTTGTLSSGTPYTFSAGSETTAGDAMYYQFYYRANYGTPSYDTSPWVLVQAYSTNDQAIYSFPSAGSYVVVVRSVVDPYDEPAGVPIMGGVVIVE